MPMKHSIATKIFGLAVLLLCLTIALGGILLWHVTELNRDLREIATRLMPLSSSLADVNEYGLRRRLAFERMYGAYLSGSPGADVVAEAAKNYQLFTEKSNAEIARARQLLDMHSGVERNQERESEIRTLLNQIEKTYLIIMARQQEVLVLAQAGRQERAEFIRPMLSDLQRNTQAARQQMQDDTAILAGEAVATAAGRQASVVRLTVATTATAVLLGLVMAWMITRRLVDPVWRLVAGMKSVEGGNLNVELPVRSRDEVGQLTHSFNFFVRELRSKEEIKQTFGKFVDPRIVERVLLQAGREVLGDRRVMTVSFSDMVGFTALGEHLTPSAMVKVLNRYFTLQAEAVQNHRGVIDKFIGDAVMAFWGPPFTTEQEHAVLACTSALDQMKSLMTLQAELAELTGLRKDAPKIEMRIGISTGDLVVGTIGSENARSYTVIGDTVNLGSRLEGANRVYGTRILISEATWDHVGRHFAAREIDSILVKGKSEPAKVFELLGPEGSLPDSTLRLRDQFAAGLGAYRSQNWDCAENAFLECLKIRPDDGPAQVFLSRFRHLREKPPGDSWNGIWELDSK